MKKTTKAIQAASIVSMLVHLVFYVIHAFVLKICGISLDMLYAIAIHVSIGAAAFVFWVESESKFVGVLSVYTLIFELTSLGSFFVMGLFFNKPYFYYKVALLASIPIGLVWILIEHKVNVKKNANTISRDC